MKYTDAQIEALIAGIERSTITELLLPEDYYRAVAEYLKRAVYEGFAASLKTVAEVDRVVLEELVTNVYMFGAAKTFQQTQAISSLLVDEDGVLRSSREFRDIARATYDNWNTAWGETEYITAVGQADMAAKWQEIERQKDIMPNLPSNDLYLFASSISGFNSSLTLLTCFELVGNSIAFHHSILTI